jgi:hypothetical protein
MRPTIAVVAVVNAVAAAGGGVCMIFGFLSLGPEVTPRLPWGSAALGGVALILCVAVPNAVLAVLAIRNDRRLPVAAVAVGLLLVAWILVELAIIRELSFFHPFYVSVGLALVLLGRRLEQAAPVASELPATADSHRPRTGGAS